MNLRIKEAINYFNENRKVKEVKLTQKTLGIIVLSEAGVQQSIFYMSRWCNGKEYGKLKPEHIIRICEKTGVSPNFLYGYEEKKK